MIYNLYLTFNFRNFRKYTVVFIMLFSFGIIINYAKISKASIAVGATSLPVIIVDAGHGGEDGGTQSSDGTLEKDINLDICLKINSLLEESGFKTVMVRDGDYMIYDESASNQRQKKVSDIHNRMKIVEENDNCILLSIHQNYFKESKYSGTQVFYSKNNILSEFLAEEIQKSVVASLQPENTRQIKESGSSIYLLYHSNVPAVMVECGFMSNEEENKKLKDEDYQYKISQSIVNGLVNYIEKNPRGDINNGSENKKYFRVQ